MTFPQKSSNLLWSELCGRGESSLPGLSHVVFQLQHLRHEQGLEFDFFLKMWNCTIFNQEHPTAALFLFFRPVKQLNILVLKSCGLSAGSWLMNLNNANFILKPQHLKFELVQLGVDFPTRVLLRGCWWSSWYRGAALLRGHVVFQLRHEAEASFAFAALVVHLQKIKSTQTKYHMAR